MLSSASQTRSSRSCRLRGGQRRVERGHHLTRQHRLVGGGHSIEGCHQGALGLRGRLVGHDAAPQRRPAGSRLQAVQRGRCHAGRAGRIVSVQRPVGVTHPVVPARHAQQLARQGVHRGSGAPPQQAPAVLLDRAVAHQPHLGSRPAQHHAIEQHLEMTRGLQIRPGRRGPSVAPARQRSHQHHQRLVGMKTQQVRNHPQQVVQIANTGHRGRTSSSSCPHSGPVRPQVFKLVTHVSTAAVTTAPGSLFVDDEPTR